MEFESVMEATGMEATGANGAPAPSNVLHLPRQLGATLRRTEPAPTMCADDTPGGEAEIAELGVGASWHIVALTGRDEGFLLGPALAEHGHEITTFASVRTLLDAGAIARADVLMVATSPEGAPGREETRRFIAETRELRPTLPIFYYGAEGSPREVRSVARRRAQAAGADDYVSPADSVPGTLGRVATLIHDRAMRIDPLTLEAGTVVPGTAYRVERQLGEGGMGSVFLARHMTIERMSALKVLSPRHVRDPRSVRTFRNEARASARIGSAHIVDVYDFIELDDGRLILCMEFLDGVSLDHVLDSASFDTGAMLAVARQICHGLHAAHRAGIVHRDIKPDNVMLVHHDGRERFVKLLDFGISAIAAEHRGSLPVAGTPGYMAPETISGGEALPSADMYALGCVLFEWACGRLPFEGTTQRVLMGHAQESPPAVGQAAQRQLPQGLVEVIERCLAKEPGDRYADMAALEAALIEVQLAEGITTAWDDLPPLLLSPEASGAMRARARRLRRGLRELKGATARRRRTWWSIGAAAALVVAAAGAGQWIGSRTETIDEVTTAALAAHAPAALAAAERHDYLAGAADGGASALEHLLALERSDDADHRERARRLRRRIAGELVAAADELWRDEGTREQGERLYAQARVFDPDNREAATRSGLSGLEFQNFMIAATEGRLSASEVGGGRNGPTEPREDAGPARHRRTSAAESEGKAEAEGKAEVEGKAERPRQRARGRSTSRVERWLARGRAAQKKRNYDDARRYYAKVLDRKPGHLSALDGLAQTHYARGSYRDAAKYARMAARRGSKRADRWLMLGDAEYKLLHYSKARSAYDRAKKLGSNAASGRLRKVSDALGG